MKSNNKHDTKLEKDVLTTRSNIESKLLNPECSAEELSSALGRYKHVPEALNWVFTVRGMRYTLLSLAVHFYLTGTDAPKMKQIIALFLSKGAKGANVPDGQGPSVSPVLTLFDNPLINKCSDAKKQEISDVLALFLKYPENLQAKTSEGFNLAHLAAPVSLDSLKLIQKVENQLLNSASNQVSPNSLFNARSEHGTTPLYFALSRNQEAAFWLIDVAQVNVHTRDSRGLTILSSCLMAGNVALAKALINRQSPLLFDQDILIRDNEKGEMKQLLEESGYYLGPRSGETEVYCAFVNQGKKFMVKTPHDLNALTFTPAPSQLQRLQVSFTELLEEPSLPDETMALYHAFTQKFSWDNSNSNAHLTLAKTKIQETLAEPLPVIKTPKSIFELFNHVFLKFAQDSNNQELKDEYYQEAKKLLQEPCMAQMSLPELLEFIDSFYNTSMTLLYSDENYGKEVFLEFGARLHLQFTKRILYRFLELANQQQIEDYHGKLLYLVSFANNSINMKNSSKEEYFLALLDTMTKTYTEKNIRIAYLHDAQAANHILKFFYYFEHGLYEESLNLILELHKFDQSFNSKRPLAPTRSFLVGFVKHARKCLNLLDSAQWDLDRQVAFVDAIEAFAEFAKLKTREEILAGHLQARCTQTRLSLTDRYSRACSTLLQGQSEFLSLKLNVQALQIDVHFEEGVDTKQLAKLIGKIPHVSKYGEAYCIRYVGKSLEDLRNSIESLLSVKASPLCVQATEKPQKQNPAATESYYLPPPALATSINSAGSAKAGANTLAKAKNTLVNKSATVLFDLEKLKEEVRQKLKLGPEVELYSLKNPLFPENKQHVLWGCWIKDSLTLDAEVEENHKGLLKEMGQLALKNKGKNGLKSVTFFNTDTHVEAKTLKTKQVTKDERVVGVPYSVALSTKDLATVYCFGILTHHGCAQLRISPSRFLAQFQVQDESHSNANTL
jgi:hypothetical protein